MARMDLKNCTIKLKDGAANEMEINIGEGNIKYALKRNVIYVKNRGKLGTVRLGDQEPVTVTFDGLYEFMQLISTDAPSCSIRDFLKREGNAASFTTAGADPCEPYAVTIEITQDQHCAGVLTEVVTLTEFRVTKISPDLRNGMIQFTGTCNIQFPTIVRA